MENPKPLTSPTASQQTPFSPTLGFSIYDILGQIEVVTAAPSGTPKDFYGSVKLYVDSITTPTVRRIYFYNNRTASWNYAALT